MKEINKQYKKAPVFSNVENSGAFYVHEKQNYSITFSHPSGA